MRLMITGSRTWVDKDRMWHVLDRIVDNYIEIFKERFIAEGLVLVSGHAKGADALAEWWFQAKYPLEQPELWRAEWKKYGGRAGIIRNTAMVDSTPDSCVAFIMDCENEHCSKPGLHGTHGATHCSDYADLMGIATSRFYGGRLL